MTNIAPDHPKRGLLFFVEQDVEDWIRSDVRDFVAELASSRRWVIGPPLFVDMREEPEDYSRGDLPRDIVGGYLEIYSALPPWTLPREVSLQHLEEVTALLSALEKLSSESVLNFEVEFGGELIGTVMGGKMDEGLSVGLLGEWRRSFGLSS